MSTTDWIFPAVLVLLALWTIVIYNGLIAMLERVNRAFADIDAPPKPRCPPRCGSCSR
jgi:LemA protein